MLADHALARGRCTAGKKAEMTSAERVAAALELRETDRVPVVLFTVYCGIKYAGCKVGEGLADDERYIRAELKCLDDFGSDAVWAVGGVDIVAFALGAEVRFLEDDAPQILEHPIRCREDLERMRSVDVMAQGEAQRRLRRVRKLKKAVGKEVPVVAVVQAPFNTACQLRGVENLYKNMISDPDFVTAILEFATERDAEHALALAEAGADVIWMGNSVAGGLSISRKHYEQFAHPYSRRIFHQLKASGVRTALHTCGNWNDRFDIVADEGADVWHVSEYADLSALKTLYGDRVCLMGNVGSVGILKGPPERVGDEAAKCIEDAGKGGGFILSADCGIPRDAPWDNVMALAKAARNIAYTTR
ncbi:MAG: uroporphyrinogen decarboxylase family protein [Chloroflexi bacterium]|nr:uroporphyrinogen decarboxylase family protein [Chloroflexota bacterium]